MDTVSIPYTGASGKNVSINVTEHADGSDKFTVIIKGDDGERKQVSDGYHTHDELYEHRHVLFMIVASKFEDDAFLEEAPKPGYATESHSGYVYKSKVHSDGSSYEGYFLLGIDAFGRQITYHLPERFWDRCNFALTLDKAPEFDGHTSEDVLNRLLDMLG